MSRKPNGGRYNRYVTIAFDRDEIPASILKFKPQIYSDGNMFLVQKGPNVFEGTVGSGKTPQKAMQDFERQYQKLKKKKQLPAWFRK
jgi:hypothetical protein